MGRVDGEPGAVGEAHIDSDSRLCVGVGVSGEAVDAGETGEGVRGVLGRGQGKDFVLWRAEERAVEL